eukprot:136085-Prorocentrum_lima.AAC.1
MDDLTLERSGSLEEKRPESGGARTTVSPLTLALLEAPAPQEAQGAARGGHFGKAAKPRSSGASGRR